MSSAIHWGDSPPFPLWRQTRISYEQNGFPWSATKTNKDISQIIKKAVPEILGEGDEIQFGSFNRENCLTWIWSMKPVKKFIFYTNASLALLYLADMLINILKTRFSSFFSRMLLNTLLLKKFPPRAKQMSSKGHQEAVWSLCSKFVIFGNSKWV